MRYKVLMKRSTMMIICTEEPVDSIMKDVNDQHRCGGVWRVNHNFSPLKCSCKGLTDGRGLHYVLVPRMIKEEA